jgi:phenylalanyl-tRNA synthetase beta chain
MPMPFLAPGDLERCGLGPGGLVLANPLAAEESILRTSLLPGLVAAVAHNERHRMPGVGLFEVGRVFGLGERGVITDVTESELAGRVLSGESEHVAVVLAGREAPAAVEMVELMLRSVGRWHPPAAELLAPSVAEAASAAIRTAAVPGLHPGRSAVVELDGVQIGQVGEIDPDVATAHDITERVAWAQLDLTTLLALPSSVPQARPVSRFPSSDIDLAFVVDEAVPAADVRRTLLLGSGSVLPVAVELFDVFRSEQLGDGRKSLAFRLRFQEPDRTLTDGEVAAARTELIDAAAREHGAELRG